MHLTDYLILAVYLVILGLIAWHHRKVSAHDQDFFLAGRSIGALPVGLSVMVTTFSAVNYLALPGEVYGHGLYVIASLPAFFLAALPITLYWMPFFHKLKAVSVYAFLEERFDLRVRLLCSSLFLIWRLFWMSVALYASCRITCVLTGLPFVPVLLICGLAATVYSALGGMKAVIWTDVMQFCVLFGSILTAVILVYSDGSFLKLISESGRLVPFSPPDWKYLSFDPTERITLWSGLIGTFVTFMTRFGADQMVMQRYLSAKSLKAAQNGLWVNAVSSTISLSLLILLGLAVAVFAKKSGVPAGTPPIKVIGTLIRSFPAGTAGLIGAGLLAATMSSIDSGLNSCSAAITVDFQQRLCLRRIQPWLLTCILALITMLSAGILMPVLNKDQTLFVLLNKIVNTIGTPLLAVMCCALFFKKTAASAVFRGTLAGFILTILLSFMVHHLALHYYALLSLLITISAIFVFQISDNIKKTT